MDKHNEVLLNTFVISKKKYRVFYNAGALVWEAESSKKDKTTVSVSDIISVRLSSTASGRVSSKHVTSNIPPSYGTTSSTHAPINESLDYDRIPVLPTSESTTTNATVNTVTTTTTSNGNTRDNFYDLLNNDASSSETILGGNTAITNYLIINYARLVSPRTSKWRVQQLVLFNSEQRIIRLWYNRLSDDIKDLNRPKNLLIFLNPYGGKQKAFALFEKYGKPLFKLAQVDINLIITQRAQQIYDIMTSQTINLNSYDGVVCCGGDGTFAELFNGLVYRTMIDLGLDVRNPPYLPKPNIPIGIIPAGSTDTVAYCLNGTTDVKTSIIHIILGQSYGLDISSVYRKCDIDRNPSFFDSTATSAERTDTDDVGTNDRPQLLKLYASVISYGFLGDVAKDSEKYRWMGPKRYEYSGVKKFLKNHGYKGSVAVQLEKETGDGASSVRNNPHDGVRCVENCQRCQFATAKVVGRDDCEIEEKIINGKFLMVNGANISCACSRSPQGFNPYCHLGDGYIDLILVRHTSFFNNIRLFLAMSSKSKKISDLPFVEIYRTRKFTFNSRSADADEGLGHENSAIEEDSNQTGTSSSPISANHTAPDGSAANEKRCVSRWNYDGEVLSDTDIIVECNCQLINVFRRGISCSDSSSKANDSNNFTCCGLCK